MVGLKTANPKVRNVDLIHTYYSGKKTPSKKEVVIYKKHNNPGVVLKILYVILSLVVIISVAAIAARLIFSRIQRPAAIALFPAKYISSLPYYSYELIKGKAQPIVLRDASPSSIIGFEKPRDLSSCTIMFSARGERGIEKIAVILRDVNMMSNANPDDIILTTPLSSKNWQRFNIRLKELNLPLDKSRVTQIRFDAREVLTSVAGSGNIYIKDIQTNN